jgi:hypothetical protein
MVLIVTTAVDVVGNLLVILSVLRNRKLRNAGEHHSRCCTQTPLVPSAFFCSCTLVPNFGSSLRS